MARHLILAVAVVAAAETRRDTIMTVETRQTIDTRAAGVAGGFPARRMRRLRRTESLRRLVRETSLHPSDFIYPLFIAETISAPQPISSMPGQMQWPLGALGARAREIAALGIGGVLLFGIPAEKDELGSQAYARE